MSTEIAQTILAQLGGRRFTVMTGAKNYLARENGLQMTLPASLTKKRANRVIISLNGRDLYDIEIGKYSPKNFEYTVIETREDVYVENLQETFTALTGLDTHL